MKKPVGSCCSHNPRILRNFRRLSWKTWEKTWENAIKTWENTVKRWWKRAINHLPLRWYTRTRKLTRCSPQIRKQQQKGNWRVNEGQNECADDEFRNKNDGFCIKNDGFCVKNGKVCIEKWRICISKRTCVHMTATKRLTTKCVTSQQSKGRESATKISRNLIETCPRLAREMHFKMVNFVSKWSEAARELLENCSKIAPSSNKNAKYAMTTHSYPGGATDIYLLREAWCVTINYPPIYPPIYHCFFVYFSSILWRIYWPE